MMTEQWRTGDTAPKTGKPIWAWLYDEGIHLVCWASAEENAADAGEPERPEEYIACWVKVTDPDDGDWKVMWWLPFDAIQVPPSVGLATIDRGRPNLCKRWRDGAPPLSVG